MRSTVPGLFGSVNSLGSLNGGPTLVTSNLIGARRLSKPNTPFEPFDFRPAMKLTTAQPARHPTPTTKASALTYLIFDRPDLGKAEQF
ncbi:hypothetical protein P0D80_41535, partial [Paraburkholderia sp. RL17-373-BIF-A]